MLNHNPAQFSFIRDAEQRWALATPRSAVAGPHQEVIEACRKADWIDATQGWLRKGISRSAVVNVQLAFPNSGFHQSLLRLAKDYGGSTIVGGTKLIRGIVKW